MNAVKLFFCNIVFGRQILDIDKAVNICYNGIWPKHDDTKNDTKHSIKYFIQKSYTAGAQDQKRIYAARQRRRKQNAARYILGYIVIAGIMFIIGYFRIGIK